MIRVDRGHDIDDVVAVARERAHVELSDAAVARVMRSRELLERVIAEGRPMYGVTRGVGALSETAVSSEQSAQLSRNILLSHACGVGQPLGEPQVRAIMFCALLNFAQGRSGIRLETLHVLIDLLNRRVTPWIPAQGGMGSLTHMAHVGLAMMGLGRTIDGDAPPTGWLPREKEGLSLVNGTPSKSGLASLVVHDARRLAAFADVSGAMSFEALRGTTWAYDARVHEARPHPGQRRVADNLRRLLKDSEIAARYRDHRVQDALSLRAIPQVHGACRDQIEHAARALEIELDSATDNPMIFEEDGNPVVISANNAHGQPLGLALDALCMALSELASMSERRVDRLLSRHHSGLPEFLIESAGVNCGLMIPQYVAASLVAENKVLSHPLSVDSIPTTSGQEDHWSMATPGALKAAQVLSNAQKVVAVELLVAAQALEFHRPLLSGLGTRRMHELIRGVVPEYTEDRALYEDMERVIAAVQRGDWLREIEGCVGRL